MTTNSLSPNRAECRRSASAFTLVELLVVIAIIALLASMLAPTMYRMREITRRATCGQNCAQIAKAIIGYTEDGTLSRGTPKAMMPSVLSGTVTANWATYAGNPAGLMLLNSSKRLSTSAVLLCPSAGATGDKRQLNLDETVFSAPTYCYSYLTQVPFSGTTGPAYTPSALELGAAIAVIGDRSPRFNPDSGAATSATDDTNSDNHTANGQNIAKLDGSTKWCTTPVDSDNFYRSEVGAAQTATGVRKDYNDSLLGP